MKLPYFTSFTKGKKPLFLQECSPVWQQITMPMTHLAGSMEATLHATLYRYIYLVFIAFLLSTFLMTFNCATSKKFIKPTNFITTVFKGFKSLDEYEMRGFYFIGIL